MPVYEYECGKCACRFDLRQGFDASPEAICPQCKGIARRVFAPVPVIFKGSGFYVNDYPKQKAPAEDGGNGHKPAATDAKTPSAGKIGARIKTIPGNKD